MGAGIPGNQGISTRLHPTAHQTLDTCQTSTLHYLYAPPPPLTPAHLVHDCCLFWWNDLPVDIRIAETLITFKRRLKTHLFRLQLSLHKIRHIHDTIGYGIYVCV